MIADAADNPGAGCGGDSTWLLHALLESGVSGAALGMVYDPNSMKRILAAGEGQVVALQLGGYSGALAGPPLVGQFEVLCIRVNASIDAMPGYPPIEVGPLAAVRMGGIDIVVSAYREQVFGPRLFREVGLEPREKRVVVLKSAQHFYKAFEPIAARILYCDSPCSRSVNFASLPFASRRTPVWPIDPCTDADIPAPRVFYAPKNAPSAAD
ncbi:MAG: MlrC C-terminal domain-containing protein [Halioglobus sp.]